MQRKGQPEKLKLEHKANGPEATNFSENEEEEDKVQMVEPGEGSER